ncbi:MAG: hypothetical protein H0X66_09120 [Verrucomicrobia bacterium]|nr:hypothetical protein [Verrucomicrobiota bacterium]
MAAIPDFIMTAKEQEAVTRTTAKSPMKWIPSMRANTLPNHIANAIGLLEQSVAMAEKKPARGGLCKIVS